jgi:acyl carrier protein
MGYAEIRQEIIDWLDDNVHFGDAAQLVTDDEASFLDGGILDSLGFVQLILFLENSHHIKLERKDLTRENFDGMAKIVSYVTNHPDFAPSV